MHLGHRSHFGSRYKLGCCGHAGLFCRGSEACVCKRRAMFGNWHFGLFQLALSPDLRFGAARRAPIGSSAESSRSPIWTCAASSDLELRGELQISDLEVCGELRFGAPRRAPDLRFGAAQTALTLPTSSPAIQAYKGVGCQDTTHLFPTDSALRGSWLPGHYPSLPRQLRAIR